MLLFLLLLLLALKNYCGSVSTTSIVTPFIITINNYLLLLYY